MAPSSIALPYTPPFDWEFLCDYLAKRAIAGVESIEDGRYLRTVNFRYQNKHYLGWLAVEHLPNQQQLQLQLSPTLHPVAAVVIERVSSLFDLACNPHLIAKALADLAASNLGVRLPGAFDGFETAVRAILGQQITVAAATTLSGRVARQLGRPIETPFPSLTHTFPTPAQMLQNDQDSLGQLGIVRTRSRAILSLANAIENDGLQLTPTDNAANLISDLKALPGIGDWTAQYIAMRTLGWRDAFPATDYGVLKALGVSKGKDAIALAEKWRPYRAYATLHLWRSLG